MKINFSLIIAFGLWLNSSAQIVSQPKPYQLWYKQPAPNPGGVFKPNSRVNPQDSDWENWSLPIGNGYMGANIFGRTDVERIQLSEKSLYQKGMYGAGSFTNFAELYLDINHPNPQNYTRSLDINQAIAQVSYDYYGVNYQRQYFANYPDKVIVIKLKANQKGKLNFTVRPVIPYLREYGTVTGNSGKMGKVVAEGNLITLSGSLEYYGMLFEGQIKVQNFGGKITSTNDSLGVNGKIVVTSADSVILLATLATNYKLEPNAFILPREKKLASNPNPHSAVTETLEKAVKKSYKQLFETHINDYQTYYNRVAFDLGGQVPIIPTNELLANYKKGDHNPYLEEMYFHYGRYLMISSSREGALPANLQGAWTQYEISPWDGGYFHNINVQMNYWPVFSTNLAEMFKPYADYYEAYLPNAILKAKEYLNRNYKDKVSPVAEENGWTMGVVTGPFSTGTPGGHSGPGMGGLTSKMFADYYEFTRDANISKNLCYPALLGMSKFLSKTLKDTAGLLLVPHSASPEQMNSVTKKAYDMKGCGFDQQMIYENHADLLKIANFLKITDNPFLILVKEQLSKLDPIQVGLSGQIKEYREENYYGEFGDPKHRHISHLVALYPGSLINDNTPVWMDAAKISLNNRGDKSTGWATAHRLNCWARTKDGDRAYIIYQTLLKNGTLNNLWDTHPPFQIDGNFGGTSGIAEMLLQSHEGYLAPLAALPQSWKNGSFRGLVARGNFEVSVGWKDGSAQKIEVLSKSGETCTIKYDDISKATLKSGKGIAVSFEKIDRDKIAFKTIKGEKYVLTNLLPKQLISVPIDLKVTDTTNNEIKLKWQASPEAVSYQVYKAEGSSATYTLVGKNVKSTEFSFKVKDWEQKTHCLIKVTAMNANGRESKGVLVNPKDRR